jgi:Putative Actinobacterial Holin-X, holin superfamily III
LRCSLSPRRPESRLRSGWTGGATLTRAAERVADHAGRFIRLELELATLELKRKAAAAGLGIGLLVGGAVFGLLAVAFALAAAAVGIAAVLSLWIALLIVAGAGLLLAGALTAAGIRSVRKGAPPVPELALHEARETKEALTNASG